MLKSARSKLIVLINCILAITLAGFLVWQANRVDHPGYADRYRHLKIERHHLAGLIDILKANQAVVTQTNTYPQSAESITLSLLESVKAAAAEGALVLHQLSVTQSEESEPDAWVSILSVQFSLSIHRAANLLLVFDAVREVAAWRAFEVRGCELAREPARKLALEPKSVYENTLGLQATCIIDVYYYPRVDA